MSDEPERPKIEWWKADPKKSAGPQRPINIWAKAAFPNFKAAKINDEDDGRSGPELEPSMTIEELRTWWRYQNDPRNTYPRELAEADLKVEKERRAKNPDQWWGREYGSDDEEILRIQRIQENLKLSRSRDRDFDRER